MSSMNNNSLFSDLNNDEMTVLNGGAYCVAVWALRCYSTWYGRVCKYVRVVRCY
ncbi:MAG TPA: hypothetical protein V6C65_16300 [Allocoleopsis sp.]